jgi:hypothetical protein
MGISEEKMKGTFDFLETINALQHIANGIAHKMNTAIVEDDKVYFAVKDVSLSRPVLESTAGSHDYFVFLFEIKLRHFGGIVKISYSYRQAGWTPDDDHVYVKYEPFAQEWLRKVHYVPYLEFRYDTLDNFVQNTDKVANKVHTYYLMLDELEKDIKDRVYKAQEWRRANG